jgi:hypothetical protein
MKTVLYLVVLDIANDSFSGMCELTEVRKLSTIAA